MLILPPSMTNTRKNHSPKILKFVSRWLFPVLILGGLGYFYYHAQNKGEKRVPKVVTLGPKALTDGLISVAVEVQKRFESGDTAGELLLNSTACVEELGNVKGIDALYSRCNPDFLQCIYSGKIGDAKKDLSFKYEGKVFLAEFVPYIDKKIYQVLSRTNSSGTFLPAFAYEFRLRFKEYPHSVMTFSLENSCSDVFLPRRKYAYGEEVKTEILEWDNFDANIFVDKFLVSNRDIREWNEATQGKITFDEKQLAMPATALRREEKQQFCSFHGKRLMEAHVFDAARFLPTDMSDSEPVKVKRGPYYWTKDSKQTFLFKKDKKLVNFENCHYAYVAECEKLVTFDPYYPSPTWMGINQALGGVVEFYRNSLFPGKSIKLSSSKFSVSDKVHVIGKHDFENNMQSGFRCMTVSPFIVRENDND